MSDVFRKSCRIFLIFFLSLFTWRVFFLLLHKSEEENRTDKSLNRTNTTIWRVVYIRGGVERLSELKTYGKNDHIDSKKYKKKEYGGSEDGDISDTVAFLFVQAAIPISETTNMTNLLTSSSSLSSSQSISFTHLSSTPLSTPSSAIYSFISPLSSKTNPESELASTFLSKKAHLPVAREDKNVSHHNQQSRTPILSESSKIPKQQGFKFPLSKIDLNVTEVAQLPTIKVSSITSPPTVSFSPVPSSQLPTLIPQPLQSPQSIVSPQPLAPQQAQLLSSQISAPLSPISSFSASPEEPSSLSSPMHTSLTIPSEFENALWAVPESLSVPLAVSSEITSPLLFSNNVDSSISQNKTTEGIHSNGIDAEAPIATASDGSIPKNETFGENNDDNNTKKENNNKDETELSHNFNTTSTPKEANSRLFFFPAGTAETHKIKGDGFCLDYCYCWPMWGVSLLIFGLSLMASFLAFSLTAGLFSKGLRSTTFYKGGGYWLILASICGLTVGGLVGGLVSGCATGAFVLSAGFMCLFESVILVGRRGAWLGALGGTATGGFGGICIQKSFLTVFVGSVVGFLAGIVIGFAPFARSLKINDRYIRKGISRHNASAEQPKSSPASARNSVASSVSGEDKKSFVAHRQAHIDQIKNSSLRQSQSLSRFKFGSASAATSTAHSPPNSSLPSSNIATENENKDADK